MIEVLSWASIPGVVGFTRTAHETKGEVVILCDTTSWAARRQILTKALATLAATEPYVFLNGVSRRSTIGEIAFSTFAIIAKPAKMIGSELKRVAPGVENETILRDALQEILKTVGGRPDVVFKGESGVLLARRISRIIDASKNDTRRNKADVLLIGDRYYPISIKKVDSASWHSGDGPFKDDFSSMIAEAEADPRVQLVQGTDGLWTIEPPIARSPGRPGAMRSVFGEDIFPTGAVVVADFQPAMFSYDAKLNVVTVPVKSVYKNISELPVEATPVLYIRNSRDKTYGGRRGIRAEVKMKRKISKSAIWL